MSSELILQHTAFKPTEASLEDLLIELSKYGRPRVSKHDNGWHCGIDVFVTGKGTEFSCKSGFREPTATIATVICYNVLLKALKDLGVELNE